jgi:hypothetical protein
MNSLRGHGGATSRKAPQTVHDLEPWKLVLRPYMIIRVDSLRFIETTQRNLHTIAERVFVHGKGAAANRAKAAFRVRRRSVSRRLAFDPGEGIDRKMDKGQHGCTGVLPTHRAMANYRTKRSRNRTIAHGAAKTSTFKGDGIDHADA